MTMTATYSPEDNKLRLYPSSRLDKELYLRVREAGFIYAPKQELFVAPAWSPSREDLLIELCGEVGDEDTSLVDRAEERAERFADYSESRAEDAHRARETVSAISSGIPMGQPILIGHHSEKHARKDAERIENGMRRAVKMWETSKYWKSRAAGAIAHAKYKEVPAVRARRIKGLEADKRKQVKQQDHSAKCLKFWTGKLVGTAKDDPTKKIEIPVTYGSAIWFTSHYDDVSSCFPLDKYPRQAPASQYEGMMSSYSALGSGEKDQAVCTVEQIQEIAIRVHTRVIERRERWIVHLSNRLEYERAMLVESGGTAADKTKPEVGGACRAWCSFRGGYSLIRKVNKVSVTLLDNWGNGGQDFNRTIPFDKLSGLMSKAEVDAAREAGRLLGETPRGFHLSDIREEAPEPKRFAASEPTPKNELDVLRDQLKHGVKVVSAPQLFPTPPDLADRMTRLADIRQGHNILEPSAGTGNIVWAIARAHSIEESEVTAVEINHSLVSDLARSFQDVHVRQADFLECNGELGQFDRILMNPPFANGQDIAHIQHALTFLKPGGKLVAICANGPRQNDKLKPLVEEHGGEWEVLPEDTFKESGTGVRTVLLTMWKKAA